MGLSIRFMGAACSIRPSYQRHERSKSPPLPVASLTPRLAATALAATAHTRLAGGQAAEEREAREEAGLSTSSWMREQHDAGVDELARMLARQ